MIQSACVSRPISFAVYAYINTNLLKILISKPLVTDNVIFAMVSTKA